MAAGWIEPLTDSLADARAFRGWTLRGARRHDEDFLFALHRDAMRAYVDATWGWDEEWQRAHFAANYAPERQAVVVHGGTMGPERNHGVGTAIINAVLMLARNSDRYVELRVLRCNPAQRLYARLGFRVIDDDGARLRMRTL